MPPVYNAGCLSNMCSLQNPSQETNPDTGYFPRLELTSKLIWSSPLILEICLVRKNKSLRSGNCILLMCCMFRCVALAVLVGKVMSAHDKGSHAEVEVKVKKVLYQNPQMKIQMGSVTLYPESWTTQGCTCPILNPGQLHSLPLIAHKRLLNI